MSETTPPPSDPHLEPEILGPEKSFGRGSRRGVVIGTVAAVVVLVLGGAAFGVYQFLNGGGPRPEDALPTSTVAVLSVDLDPKAGQKIEAIKTLRKFPALRKTMGVESEDDLRRLVVDKAIAGECDGISYDDDVKPWIGKRAAVAAVDLGDKYPAPAIVLQVTDAKKAETGFADLAKCGDDELPDDLGWAIGDDYLIASDSEAHAKEILAEGEKSALADDKTYQKWSDELGGQGVVNFYISPGASQYFDDILDAMLSEMGPEFGDGFAAGLTGQGFDPDDPLGALEEEFGKFKGAAGALRFADGGMELVVTESNGAAKDFEGGEVGRSVTALPADTALALGLSVPEKAVNSLFEQLRKQGGPEVESFIDDAEEQAGVKLPEDIATLLGDAITLSIGGDAPSLEDLNDPEKVPVGLALHGDSDAQLDVISTIEDHLGVSLEEIPVVTKKGDGVLGLSPSTAYAKALTEKGKLGDSDIFQKAVPDAENAQSVFFVAIDKAWRASIAEFLADGMSDDEADEVEKNLEPFAALGFSTIVEDGVTRLQFRIATR